MTKLMNELMNYEPFYRTAPATPGLLKSTGQCPLKWENVGWFDKRHLLPPAPEQV